MIVYWFEFESSGGKELPTGTWLGCGVTAHDKKDAIELLKEKVFKSWADVPVLHVKENISLDDLEQNHVAPNIGNMMIRGIWYPNFGS